MHAAIDISQSARSQSTEIDIMASIRNGEEVQQATNDAEGNDTRVHQSLVTWIESQGGYVHPSTCLESSSSGHRGVFATRPIEQGELLVRLPACLVLSGEGDTSTCNVATSSLASPSASPWLKCIANLLRAMIIQQNTNTPNTETQHTTLPESPPKNTSVDTDGHDDGCSSASLIDFSMYMQSLPDSFEDTLVSWSDGEISNILSGTGLGELAQNDRSRDTIRCRYNEAVQPYLKQKQILSTKGNEDEDSNYNLFLKAMSCVSTRGFHLDAISNDTGATKTTTSASTNGRGASSYTGPFLLPWIDLLNHDPMDKCTTLSRNLENGSFSMTAERPIQTGEELPHSYGDSLKSAQLLQTFGFVSNRAISSMLNPEKAHHLSPALLSQTLIQEACSSVIVSNYPSTVRQRMKIKRNLDANAISDDEESDPVWELDLNGPSRNVTSVVPNDTVTISFSADIETGVWSEELITLCSLYLLPQDEFDAFMADEPSLLDKSMLDDYYLGILVCKVILVAIENKFTTYQSIHWDETTGVTASLDNSEMSWRARIDCAIRLLRSLWQDSDEGSPGALNIKYGPHHKTRTMYGLTLRLEEMTSLRKLYDQVLKHMDFLIDTDEVVRIPDDDKLPSYDETQYLSTNTSGTFEKVANDKMKKEVKRKRIE